MTMKLKNLPIKWYNLKKEKSNQKLMTQIMKVKTVKVVEGEKKSLRISRSTLLTFLMFKKMMRLKMKKWVKMIYLMMKTLLYSSLESLIKTLKTIPFLKKTMLQTNIHSIWLQIYFLNSIKKITLKIVAILTQTIKMT